MTDLKFQILKLLYQAYPLRELSRMDIIRSINENPLHIHNALKELKSKNYIKQLTCSNVFSLELLGAETYELLQEEREQATKQESQQRFNNKISVANLLIPFIIFILGLLAEHFVGFVSFLISVFK